jgi:hypothetical protein
MQANEDLIPRPLVVRNRLARSLHETRLLRRLLRLSIAAAEERQRQALAPAPDRLAGAAPRQGGGE